MQFLAGCFRFATGDVYEWFGLEGWTTKCNINGEGVGGVELEGRVWYGSLLESEQSATRNKKK